ncbi:class I poly(R)-hydroxyalkanoic acid synthase [Desulfobotulus mexicanus]|nr:class I poly(R)-hydroxyalkanoic acid synthase [Desulfobotulus mexicanus]
MEKEIASSGFDLDRIYDLMIKFTSKQKSYVDALSKNKVKSELPAPGVMFDFFEVFQKMALNPGNLLNLSFKMMKDYNEVSSSIVGNLLDPQEKEEKQEKDKRFSGEEWNKTPFFQFMKDLYLLNVKTLSEAVSNVEGIEAVKKKRVEFYTKQFLEAVSPSNFLATNPELLKYTFDHKGENIFEGIDNFLDDVNCEDGSLNIRISDDTAFMLGENIALSKGSVVYQNDILQLIQYSPTTDKVFKIPVLISPPFINKYYILDINEKISMVKWLVDQGYTVFVISWVNPSTEHASKRYEDYVLEGHIEVLDVIEKITKVKKISAIGYCTGGTILATTAAYLESKKQQRFASLTYMATLIDFSEPGEIGNFLDQSQVKKITEDIKKVGYLDGRHLAKTFNMLKPSDLIWSYAVNSYIKGRDPVPFDILYWNSDSTNLPAGMYAFYLQNMYIENRLKDPGGIKIGGVPIDISKIKTPSYFLATEDDHIVLWKSSFKGALLFAGRVRFVLGGSGHVAGVVNPPVKNKYGYRAADLEFDSPVNWVKNAGKKEGSWWLDWHDWNIEFAGEEVAKRIPGKGNFKEIEKAPGSYALRRVDTKVKCKETCTCSKPSRNGITQIKPSIK